MKRLLGLKRPRPSFHEHEEQEELDVENCFDVEPSQQVVWDDSPPSYKPMCGRDSNSMVQKELNLLQGFLAHKEDEGGGGNDPAVSSTTTPGGLTHQRQGSMDPPVHGSSLLRSFLHLKSPAVAKGGKGMQPPTSSDRSKRSRALQPVQANSNGYAPTTPKVTRPGAVKRDGSDAKSATKPSSSFFGDLARNLTSRRIRLPKMWGVGRQATADQGQGRQAEPETPQQQQQSMNGQALDNGNSLLTILDKIDERLSQGDPSPAVEDDEEEEEEEEMEDVGGRDQRRTYWADDGACAALVKEEEEERQSGQWQRSAPAHDDGFAAVEDNTGDADLDHAMAIAAAEVEVKMEQQAAGAAMEVTTEPAAAPSPSPPQPPPQPLLSPPLAPQPPRPPSCPIKPPPSPDHDRKPWDKDDDELYTEDEWAQILNGIPEPQSSRAQPPCPSPPPPQAMSPVDEQELSQAPASAAAVPPTPAPSTPWGATPLPPLSSTPPGAQAPTSFPYARFEVLEVPQRTNHLEITCEVRDKVSRREGTLFVCEDWAQCDIRKGDIVHVVWTTARQPSHHGRDGGAVSEGGHSSSAARLVCRVDNRHNYLILHPDVLVTPSSIMSAVECDRRAVLQERVQSSLHTSKAALMGNLKHELTQETLMLLNQSTRSFSRLIDGSIALDLEQRADQVLARHRVTLYSLHVPEPEARKELLGLIRPLVDWARRCYLRPSSSRPPPQQAKRQSWPGSSRADFMEVHGAASIEESVWSASLGLKGKIDATLEVTSRDPDTLPVGVGALVPLELKSGYKGADNVIRHRAQVMVYALLLADRYGNTAMSLSATDGLAPRLPAGVLAYVSGKEVDDTVVLPHEAELRALLIARNRVARAMQEPNLPPILMNHHTCSRCFNVAECLTYHRALEDTTTSRANSMGPLIDMMTSSITEPDVAYLSKWDGLLTLEGRAAGGGLADTWQRPAIQVEAFTSRCMSGMVLEGYELGRGPEGSPSHVYTFCRRRWARRHALSQADDDSAPIPRSLLELSITVGDRLLISTESRTEPHDLQQLLPFRHINVAVGTVTSLSESSVQVRCAKAMALPLLRPQAPSQGDATLQLAYEADDSRRQLTQRQSAVEDFCSHLVRGGGPSKLPRGSELVVFRLDSDNTVLNFSLMRGNLLQLFTGPATNANAGTGEKGLRLVPTPGDEKRRRLIVHLDPPTFAPPLNKGASPFQSDVLVPRPGCDPRQLAEEYRHLNADQKAALDKVLAARDYALLLGMPGTGKTSTIGFVVRTLVCRGKSVLITSYTHSAVDNLLLKLRDKGVSFLRLGRPAQVHPSLQDSLLDPDNSINESMEHLQNRLNSVLVVATTCLGIRHPILLRRRFDYCIVDEAGQIAQPVCLGPLRFADSFVLVGDDNQLPPLIVSSEAREGGMDESLFTRLAHAHPQAVQKLSYQYRMNNDIMSICNELVYNHQLRCGDAARVGRAMLPAPRLDRLRLMRPNGQSPSWLEDILRPNRCVVFLNTDTLAEGSTLEQGLLPNSQRESASNLTNPTEAKLVCQVVTGMLLAGVKPEAVAVISPLRAQLKLLRREMGHLKRIEVNTVDKYQGSDRDCIILSLVRSNAEGKLGELLKDRRRINVAVSRAKKKLVLVGSKSTLSQGDVFQDLIALLARKNWIVDLPPGGQHVYEEKDMDVLCEVAWTG